MFAGIKELVKQWQVSGTAAIITGAGASTESGLCDFTGSGSIYKGISVRTILSRTFMLKNPELFNEYCRERLYSPHAMPNSFHKALADWEKTGLVSAIITQNIDSLHQKAGSKVVYELHGNMQYVYCDACKKATSASKVYENVNHIIRCPYCKGVLRPSIVLYGESLNRKLYAQAMHCVDTVPMLILAGTQARVIVPKDLMTRFREHLGVSAYLGLNPPEGFDFDVVVQGKLGDIATELRKHLI